MTTDDAVRSFYAALGIGLPGRGQQNATVRCFANPEAHAHEDRTPSCSVSLEHGAWQCFACGARGGAYDAALIRGHTPAGAMALLTSHGLVDPRLGAASPTRSIQSRYQSCAGDAQSAPRSLACDEADVARWHAALFAADRRDWLGLVCRRRLWDPEVMRALELGYDQGRITIPIRDRDDWLHGVLRYRPGSPVRKMLAVRGTRLGLIPHPARELSGRVVLTEGPPDMIAARSRGWPAIAVPGDRAWRADWAPLLAGRSVTVLMDADAPGRAGARQIASDLASLCDVRLVDLAPERHDGFDLTDWLHHQPQRRTRCTRSSSPNQTITR